MSVNSFLHKIGAWFDKVFISVKDDFDKVAITITEGLKTALDSGILPTIVRIIPNVGPELSAWLTKNGDAVLAKALALELGLQGLPDNPTASQLEAFESEVITALAGSSAAAKSAIWTKVAVRWGQELDTALNESSNGNLTFAQWVSLIEQAYQSYIADTTGQQDATDQQGA